jgi:hypothetical protein
MRRRKKIYYQFKTDMQNQGAQTQGQPKQTQTNPKPVTITIVLFFPCPKET